MSQGITLREFITKWGFEVDDKELEKLDKKFAETRENFNKLTEKVSNAGKSMSTFITLPFLALAGVSANAAAEAIDASDKFTAVFKSIGQDGVKAAEDFAAAIGVSNVEGQKLLSTQGQILKSMGFTEAQAFDMSKTMGILAADIAEFNSLEGGAAQATDILKSALLGQTRGLKQIGVSIDDAAISQQIQKNAAEGMTFQTLKQAEAFAILRLVQAKTTDAAGAFADSSDELGVKTQRTQAKIANMSVMFGKIFLPVVSKVVDKVSGLVEWISSWSDGTKTLVVILGAVAAAIGPILIGIGAMMNAIMAIRTAYVLFGNAALLAQLKAVAIFALIALAVAAVILVFEDILAFFQGRNSVTGIIVEKFKEVFSYLEGAFEGMPAWIQTLVAFVTTPFRAVMNFIRGVTGAAKSLFNGDFAGAGAALLNIPVDTFAPLVKPMLGESNSLSETMGFGPRTYPSSPVNQSVVSPITINVPAGTPPDKVGPFVQKGVGDGMGMLLRETSRATTSAVKN